MDSNRKRQVRSKRLSMQYFWTSLEIHKYNIISTIYQTGLQGNGDGAASHPGDTEYS